MPEQTGARGMAAAVLWLMLSAISPKLQDGQTAWSSTAWDEANARALLVYVEQTTARHGLEPESYAPDRLRDALDRPSGSDLSASASDSFSALARDLATGRVPPARRSRFNIPGSRLDAAALHALEARALERGDVAGALDGLAPQNAEYSALSTEIMKAGDELRRARLAVNLERLRWMPRDRSRRYLWVNIPEYTVQLVENDRVTASHRVIVGKRSTPTPQFAAEVSAVILNPTWTVPDSIIAESIGALVRNSPAAARARGFRWSRTAAGRLMVVQQPGAGNALGQVKLDMPNPFRVYLHDTPTKALFAENQRTFSHGCVRVEDALGLAKRLLAREGWTSERADQTVSAGATMRVPLAEAMPIFVVYLTATAGPDGRTRFHDDPYALDAGILAALGGGARLARAAEAPRTECSA